MAAPMTLASTPSLIIACCRAGVVGGFQASNAGPPDVFAAWYDQIAEAETQARRRGERFAPFVVNLLANAGLDAQAQAARLSVCAAHRAPLLLTTAGDPSAIVEAAHGWGGRVFHDATTLRHVDKAVAAGVDGLMLVTAGSGGLSGTLNPFAFVAEARRRFDGVIILAGGIADGRGVAAALALGADMVCMGTRFIATQESGAPDAYRDMLIAAGMDDVLYTPALAGIPANFLRPSIVDNGLDPDRLPPLTAARRPDLPPGVRAWRTLWSAGHSVSLIDDAPGVGDVVDRLVAQFDAQPHGAGWRERLAQRLAEPRGANALAAHGGET